MGRTNPIKNPAFPLLVGLDHNDKALIAKAEGVIERFAQKGKKLFIEGDTFRRPSSPKYDPFDAAVMKAVKNGMVIVKLDVSSFFKLRKKLWNSPAWQEYEYFLYDVRERHWIKTIRKRAKAGDIVIMHQDHLRRVSSKLCSLGFGQNVWFLSKFSSGLGSIPPLSKAQVRKLKKARAARRPINIRRKK